MNLCCTVNPFVKCACGMYFCREHYRQESILANDASLAGGHITRIGDYWDNKGLCTVLNKVVTGGRRHTQGVWPIIVLEEV